MALTPMLAPIIMIGIVMVTLGDIFIKMITIIPKLLKLAMKIFNPEVFIRDLLFGIFTALYMILGTITDTIRNIIETIFFLTHKNIIVLFFKNLKQCIINSF